MKHFLPLIAIVCLFAVTLQAQNTIDKQGRKQGHWIKVDKDGSKIFEGDFKDGHEVGTFRYYYPDGTLRILNEFDADGKRCRHEAYDEKGRKVATGFYNQKNRDGEWRLYAEDGRLVKIANYRMGIREGQQVIFNADGDTAEVSNWLDNRRHGRWWKRIGKQGYITGIYKHGGLEGDVKEYNDQQQMVSHGQYRNGMRHGFYRYYEDGVLSVDETWNEDNMESRKIRIMTPEAQMISMYEIAYLMPKGSKKVLLYTIDGRSIDTYEPTDNLYYRLGNTHFFMANKKQRVMVSNDCVRGIIKNGEDGATYLDLDPKPDFKIYPDEDCIKAVEAVQREGLEGLQEE
ncbi:MAG: hypothetical protein IJU90_09585 [Bacteroidales bacterium]|nr:hypothetical protein [Bacteroidales bacterium]